MLFVDVSSKLTIGDVVRLNSGSPLLTVVRINDDMVIVQWLRPDGSIGDLTAPAACFTAAADGPH